MIAPLLAIAVAVPILAVLWFAAWVVGDLLAGPEPAVVRVRSGDRRR